ncbi:hypothetical protein BDA99DRAFT_536865 [Phascolomyces articulosus]|uniref:Uncharacterized protein n=1 Tax=Phascolomyces articulosus TaxID=60185 RepID=A0AAD5KB65_9FUNG|nr:hypothetical protein BDA99DRAFT_536865 [Phascolomyces articulosus]
MSKQQNRKEWYINKDEETLGKKQLIGNLTPTCSTLVVYRFYVNATLLLGLSQEHKKNCILQLQHPSDQISVYRVSVKIILIIILYDYIPKCCETLPNAATIVELSKCKKRGVNVPANHLQSSPIFNPPSMSIFFLSNNVEK